MATMLSALAFYSIAFLLFSFVKTVKAAGAIAAIILNFSMILSAFGYFIGDGLKNFVKSG